MSYFKYKNFNYGSLAMNYFCVKTIPEIQMILKANPFFSYLISFLIYFFSALGPMDMLPEETPQKPKRKKSKVKRACVRSSHLNVNGSVL